MKKLTNEVAPPGFEKAVKAMKKDKDVENPYAIAWSMKKKGYKPSDVKENDDDDDKEDRDDELLLDDEEGDDRGEDACPGCGCCPSDGVSDDCEDPLGCGWAKTVHGYDDAKGFSLKSAISSPLDDFGSADTEVDLSRSHGEDDVDEEEEYVAALVKKLDWNESVDRGTRSLFARMNTLAEVDVQEATMAQAKVEVPLKNFVQSIKSAQHALGDLVQQVTDPKATAQAEWLLKATQTILKNLDKMPDLTQDPWKNVRVRENDSHDDDEQESVMCQCGGERVESMEDGYKKCTDCGRFWMHVDESDSSDDDEDESITCQCGGDRIEGLKDGYKRCKDCGRVWMHVDESTSSDDDDEEEETMCRCGGTRVENAPNGHKRCTECGRVWMPIDEMKLGVAGAQPHGYGEEKEDLEDEEEDKKTLKMLRASKLKRHSYQNQS